MRRLLTLAPFARGTLDVSTVHGLADEEFATILESDQPVVADRTMTLGRHRLRQSCRDRDGHPASTWYLAEGATINGFRLFYLLQNPNPIEATVTIEYLLGRGLAPVTRTYRLAPQSRDDARRLDAASRRCAPPRSRRGSSTACGDAHPRRARDVPRMPAAACSAPGTPAPASRRPRRHGRSPKARPARISTPSCCRQPVERRRCRSARRSCCPREPPCSAPTTSPPRAASTSGSTRQRRNSRTPVSRRARVGGRPALRRRARDVVAGPDGRPTGARRTTRRDRWPTSAAWGLAEGMLGGAERDRHLRAHRATPRRSTAWRGDAVVRRRRRRVPRGTIRAGAQPRQRAGPGSTFRRRWGGDSATLVESQGAVPAQLVVERAMYADSGRERWAAGTNALGTPLGEERVITITPQGVTPRVLVVSPGERITDAAISTPSRTRSSPGPYLERSTCPALNQIGYLRARRITRVGQLQHRRHLPLPGRRPRRHSS